MRTESRPWWMPAVAVFVLSCGSGSTDGTDGTDDADMTQGDSNPPVDAAPPDFGPRPDTSGDWTPPDLVPDTGIDVPDQVADLPPPDLPDLPDLSDGGAVDIAPPDQIPVPDIDWTQHCSPPGDSVFNVYDLQDADCPDHPASEPTEPPGIPVVLDGLVVTAAFSDIIFAQEEPGGPYSGIALYMHGIPTGDYEPGDRINVEGGYQEFFGLSEVYVEVIEEIGTGPAPDPFPIVHPSHIATGGELAEAFEGVLVVVQDILVIHTMPDCPNDFGEFLLAGELRVDDMGSWQYTPNIQDHLAEVVGPLNYTFNNFKLEPRTDDDIVVISKGGDGVSKCVNRDCHVAEDAVELGELVLNELMIDPFGNDTLMEFVELHNPQPYPVDVRGWRIADCAVQSFDLEWPTPLLVPAGGYFVLGPTADLESNGGTPIDHAWGTGFYLANSIGSVLLYNDLDQLVDQVRYQTWEPWLFETGQSLELTDPALDNMDAVNWTLGTMEYGTGLNQGTPGYQNGAF